MIKINCDLCGKVDENLFRTLIEGVELNVCSACCKFGKILAPIKRYTPKEQHRMFQNRAEKQEKIELLMENYAEIIKSKRESMGWSQKDFASRINEKESVVHNLETGNFEPQLSLAKKLEKILVIKIIEEHEEKHDVVKKRRDEGFTLGDFIKTGK